MYYIHKESGQYPLTEMDIRETYPLTIFPVNFIPPEEYALVEKVNQPTFNNLTETITEDKPELINGVYFQKWKIIPLDEETILRKIEIEAERLKSVCIRFVQQRLDEFAQTRNYDNILSACTYATSSVPKFQQEGQRAVNLRDATWAKLYEILSEVEAGTRPMPSGFEDIESDLPILTWESE